MREDDLNMPACLCTEVCSLFTQEFVTSLSFYHPRLQQGVFFHCVIPSLHHWCEKSQGGWGGGVAGGSGGGGGVVDSTQPRTCILFHLRSYVWILSPVESSCTEP